jgi:hypothetical protein
MPKAFRSEVLSAPTSPAIYAAAKNFTIGKARKGVPATSETSTGEPWQDTGWDFYDTNGEYRYAVDWVGNLLSRAKLFVVENGMPTENQLAIDVMAALFGGEDGQSEMLRSLGVHFTVAGEAYIIGVDDEDEDDWYVIASTEIKRGGDGTFSVKGLKLEIVEGSSLVMRLWRSHPRKPWKANSPTRAVLPILAELEKLTMHVAAQLDSRLAGAGLLLVPSEMSFPKLPTQSSAADPDAEDSSSPANAGAQAFIDMLIEVMSTAIGDRSDASALVPIVLQVAGEYLEKVQHLKFWSELDEKAIELRNEAIRRLALGMDMPPEVLTGVADVNHWGAWQIDESSIKAHSEPLLKAITSSLTSGYLHRVLEAEGMDPETARTFTIKADTSQLRMRPNRSKEAIELYEHGELSAEAMRRENGFDESDAPSEEERRNFLLWKVASGSATPEMVTEALRLLGIEIEVADQDALDDARMREARPDPSTREHPTQEPPEEIVAAAEIMVFRALERAGNKLKNRTGGRTGGAAAKDLYMRMPELSSSEVEALLDDAWSCTEWTDLGIDHDELAKRLHAYTGVLLSTRKSHDRVALRESLRGMPTSRPALVAV